MRKRGGFTLTEVMVTVAIIAIAAAFAVPQMRGYMEKERWNQANDVLMSAYMGLRVYAGKNGGNPIPTLAGGTTGEVTPTAAEWKSCFHTEDPAPEDGSVAYVFEALGGTNFRITARRVGGLNNGQVRWIDQSRTYGGDWAP